MKLIVIGSSSQGNSYALAADNGEILLLEAGVHPSIINQSVGYKMANVVGALVSHIHNDHCKYVDKLLDRMIPVFSNKETSEKYDGVCATESGKSYSVGSFRFCPFSVEHDVENYSYLVYHPEMRGSLYFATDCYNLKKVIKGVRHFLIEANYDQEILHNNVSNGKINKSQADRLALSHLSIDHCVDYLRMAEANICTKEIVLCHLSSRNSHPEFFKERIEKEFGVPTYIAKPNLNIELL